MNLVILVNRNSKSIRQLFTKISGSWVEIPKVFTKVRGEWTQLFDNGVIPPAPPVPEEPVTSPYLAVDFAGFVYTSEDGKSFIKRSQIFATAEKCMVCDGTYYYVCEKMSATPNCKRTRDGIIWENVNNFPNVTVGDFKFGGGNFVVIENNGPRLFYCSDPMATWSSRNPALSSGIIRPQLKYMPINAVWYLSGQGAGLASTIYRFKTPGDVLSALSPASGVSSIGLPQFEQEGITYFPGLSFERIDAYTQIQKWHIQCSTDGITIESQFVGNRTSSYKDIVGNNNVVVSNIVNTQQSMTTKVSTQFQAYSLPSNLEFGTQYANSQYYMSAPVGIVNGMFYAIGNRQLFSTGEDLSNITSSAYSESGSSWTASTMIAHSQVVWHKVIGNIAYCLSTDNKIQNTSDGITWEECSVLSGVENNKFLVLDSKVGL